MRRVVCCSSIAVLVSACSIGKSVKQEPDYLRQRHAGTLELTSDIPVKQLVNDLGRAAADCYATSASWTTAVIPGGIYFLARVPGRTVEAKYDEAADSGIVRVFIDGNLYLPMFQLDIAPVGNTTRVVAYHAGKNTLQRNFLPNVTAWVNDDLKACELNWVENRRR